MNELGVRRSEALLKRRDAIRRLGTVATGLGAALGAGEPASAHDSHGRQDQATGPLRQPQLHVCGVHVAKTKPGFQIVTEHYCSMLNEDVHQCLLYDSTEKNAKLLGVEYIISDKLYRQLHETEKKYWHPHTYEVLAGLLVAPGMPPEDEQKLMRALLTTWGKTWHTWPDPKTEVPLGEPLLIWSLTGDGQAHEELLARRDRRLGVSTPQLRKQRTKAFGHQVPQIDQPKTLDAIGRQWTNEGPDKPREVSQYPMPCKRPSL